MRLLHVDGKAHPVGPAKAIAQAPLGTHIYSCGPTGYIAAMEMLAIEAGFDPARRHVERFTLTPDGESVFTVIAALSGQKVQVGPKQTIADALLAVGIDMPLSCEAGICGSCMTRVIEGQPDHRDQFQSEAEKIAGQQMTVCCSRSLGPRPMLDL